MQFDWVLRFVFCSCTFSVNKSTHSPYPEGKNVNVALVKQPLHLRMFLQANVKQKSKLKHLPEIKYTMLTDDF